MHVHVASLNTAAATELCIRSLRATAGRAFTLTVGDSGSTDGSVEMLRGLEALGWLTLEVAPGGRLHTEWLDHWVRECRTDYALFVDSDVEFRRTGWLAELVDTAESRHTALVAAEILGEVECYVEPVGHTTVRLASRPAPWLLLVDPAVVAGLGVSFAFHAEQELDGTVAYDTAGWLFRELAGRGLRWAAMPPEFASAYHHYGGLSWIPLAGRRGWRKRRDLVVVRRRLRRLRRAQEA